MLMKSIAARYTFAKWTLKPAASQRTLKPSHTMPARDAAVEVEGED
jgi:hypothetical protein